MNDAERIEALEKEIAELKNIIGNKRLANPWAELSNKISKRLFVAFGTEGYTPQIALCKSAISTLIGKSYCKNSVLALSKEEVEEAEAFANYILDFVESTRKEHMLSKPVRGYEREVV